MANSNILNRVDKKQACDKITGAVASYPDLFRCQYKTNFFRYMHASRWSLVHLDHFLHSLLSDFMSQRTWPIWRPAATHPNPPPFATSQRGCCCLQWSTNNFSCKGNTTGTSCNSVHNTDHKNRIVVNSEEIFLIRLFQTDTGQAAFEQEDSFQAANEIAECIF